MNNNDIFSTIQMLMSKAQAASSSEFVQMMKGASKDYFIPYLRRQLSGSMGPVNMTQEEAKKKADDDFPPAQGQDFDNGADDYK